MEKIFRLIQRLGWLPILVRYSKTIRKIILENVHYNTEWIMNQMTAVDMITDSLMQRPLSAGKYMSLGHMETSALELNDTFKKFFGYKHVLPLSQGRLAELILTKTLSEPGSVVPNNGLFVTTRLHQEIQGLRVEEIAVPEADIPESDFPFKGNFDLAKLKALLNSQETIAYIYVETCSNASGGHPISLENLKAVYKLAHNRNVPVFLDACRILENAFLIREREAGYAQKSLDEIVKEMCSFSDGCTMSATKDLPVDTGAFLATNNENWSLKFQEMAFLVGDGLSVRSKAALNEVLKKHWPNEGRIAVRVEKTAQLWNQLNRDGVPLIHPHSGYAVFLDTRELNAFDADKHPQKSFLAELYLQSGVLACENMITARQKKNGFATIRLAIPCLGISNRALALCARGVAKVWINRAHLSGLKKIFMPDSPAGEMLARYALE